MQGGTTDAERLITAAMKFDMAEVTKRYAKDHDIDIDLAKEHELELKKFLALVAIYPKTPMGMRGQIDELWHTFIFFTKDYFDFCESVGGKYIHHVPETGEGPVSGGDYANMLELYEKHFGERPNGNFWPPIGRGSAEGPAGAICSTSCSGCGRCSSCGSGCAGCSRCSTGPR